MSHKAQSYSLHRWRMQREPWTWRLGCRAVVCWQAEYSAAEFAKNVQFGGRAADETRAIRLASMPDGSGHKTFLAGILVAANVTATQVWWLQFGRYHHAQIVTSQSKMHRLRKMLEIGGVFSEKTQPALIQSLAAAANDMTDEELAYCCPGGLLLTARITTNYLQLATMWRQRRNHTLTEWREFCNWVEQLPMADKLICTSK